MLCILLGKVLHIYYIVYYLCIRNKTNTNLKTKNYDNKNQCSRR